MSAHIVDSETIRLAAQWARENRTPPVCAACIEAAEGEPAPRGWDCVEGDDRATFEASD